MVSRSDDFDRPTRHGALLGAALARIADAAEGESKVPAHLRMPDRCSTCAFRLGSMANQCAGTLKRALDAVLMRGAHDVFWCHHTIDADGDCSRLCAGYVAAQLAPFDFTKEQLGAIYDQLMRVNENDPDHVREAFDAWLASIDPDRKLVDIYEMGRLYERDRRAALAQDDVR